MQAVNIAVYTVLSCSRRWLWVIAQQDTWDVDINQNFFHWASAHHCSISSLSEAHIIFYQHSLLIFCEAWNGENENKILFICNELLFIIYLFVIMIYFM